MLNGIAAHRAIAVFHLEARMEAAMNETSSIAKVDRAVARRGCPRERKVYPAAAKRAKRAG